MLKHLWSAVASACNYLWARLSPDVLDEGIPSDPKRPLTVLVDKRELEELRADAAEAKRNGDLLDASREECRELGAANADLREQLRDKSALVTRLQSLIEEDQQRSAAAVAHLVITCGLRERVGEMLGS